MSQRNTIKSNIKPPITARQSPAPAPAAPSKFTLRWKLALLLAAISFIVYANTLSNGFVYDDLSAITKNTIVEKGIRAIPEILSTPYRYGYWVVPNDTYRPLSLVLFAIEYQISGKNPAIFHFVTLLLYAACVALLFLFFDSLFSRRRTAVAFIATLLFALHPIHTEVVANIKSCDELLCFLFAFLSLNVFLKYSGSGKIWQLILGAFCFLLALLAKETVVSFTGIILLIFLFYKNDNQKLSIHISAGSAIAVLLFFFIRNAVFTNYHINQFANIQIIDNALATPGLPFATRIASAFLVLGYYIKLLFVPYPLIMDYSYDHIPLVTISNPLVILSMATWLFLLVFSLRRFINNRKDPFAFSILWFLITISLYSNTFMLIAATLGERFLFFPSAGFCLLLALLIGKWIIKEDADNLTILKTPKLLAVLLPISVILAVLTINRNRDWIDNLTLYSADIEKAPRSVKLNYLLGMEYLNSSKDEKDPIKQKKGLENGINYLTRSLAIYPGYDDAQSELCDAYFRSGIYDSAAVHGKLSLALNPNNPYTLNNMGGIAFNRKDYESTITQCEKAISIQPGVVDMYTNVAASFLSMGRSDSGIAWLYKAIAVDPDYPTTCRFLVMAYQSAGKPDSVKKYEAEEKRISAGR